MSKISETFFTFIQNYGETAIFFSLLMECLALPIPGELLMLMLGFLSADISAAAALVIFATPGTFTGSMAAYAIGYRCCGKRALLKFVSKEKIDGVNERLKKHQYLYIVFSRFIPCARHIVPYLSGICRVNVYKYALFNLLGAAMWCSAFIFLGCFAGSGWTEIGRLSGVYMAAIFALILFIFTVFHFFNRFKIPIIIICASITVLTLLTGEMLENELSPFDNLVYGYLSGFISTDMTSLMKFISNTGSAYALGGLAVIFLLVFRKKANYWFYGKMIVINLIFVSLLNVLFKAAIHRARPDILQLVVEHGYSFPSGHSMISAAFYGYLIYLSILFLKAPWKQFLPTALSVLVFAIGVSRIYLGVHYASDVVAGFLTGFSWLVVFITLSKAYQNRVRSDSVPPKKQK